MSFSQWDIGFPTQTIARNWDCKKEIAKLRLQKKLQLIVVDDICSVCTCVDRNKVEATFSIWYWKAVDVNDGTLDSKRENYHYILKVNARINNLL